MTCIDEAQLDTLTNTLVTKGYVIVDDVLPITLVDALLNDLDQLRRDEFKAAGIGRQTDFQLQEKIRADKIYWLEGNTKATTDFFQWMDALRVGINRRLYMGLFDYESHFAHYPVGAFYKKHLDAFRGKGSQGQSNRMLSTVLYLNENWLLENGGELLIYSEDDSRVIEKVLPVFGRLVIFLSEKFPHEVLPANRERKSIAGWFRVSEGVL